MKKILLLLCLVAIIASSQSCVVIEGLCSDSKLDEFEWRNGEFNMESHMDGYLKVIFTTPSFMDMCTKSKPAADFYVFILDTLLIDQISEIRGGVQIDDTHAIDFPLVRHPWRRYEYNKWQQFDLTKYYGQGPGKIEGCSLSIEIKSQGSYESNIELFNQLLDKIEIKIAYNDF